MGEACPQPLAPVRKPRRAVALAPENRICRPCRGPRELGSGDPPHAAVDAGLLEDRLREVGPGTVALRREMPDPALAVEQLPGRRGQMPDVGRRAALVVDDSDLVALDPEP